MHARLWFFRLRWGGSEGDKSFVVFISFSPNKISATLLPSVKKNIGNRTQCLDQAAGYCPGGKNSNVKPKLLSSHGAVDINTFQRSEVSTKSRPVEFSQQISKKTEIKKFSFWSCAF